MRFVLVLLVACGGGGQSPVDAAPDSPLPPDAPPVLAFHHYVIDSLRVPMNNTESRELGLDINNDAVVDNQLGMVLGTLAGQGFDSQTDVARAVDDGRSLTLVEVGTENAFGAGAGSVQLFVGTNPNPAACASPGDLVCRRHLDGTASFDVEPDPAGVGPVIGNFAGGAMTTNVTDTALVRISMPLLTTAPIPIFLVGPRIRVTGITETSIASGIIAGAVTQSQIDSNILPGWQVSFQGIVTRDCTGAPQPAPCGCAPNSTGRSLINLFDTDPANCTISLAEIKNNSLIQSLLAPDVRIGNEDALSLGIGFTAVPGTFTP